MCSRDVFWNEFFETVLSYALCVRKLTGCFVNKEQLYNFHLKPAVSIVCEAIKSIGILDNELGCSQAPALRSLSSSGVANIQPT